MIQLIKILVFVFQVPAVIIALLSSAQGQNNYIDYHLKVYEARKLYYNKQFSKAAQKYIEAFNLVDYIHVSNLLDAQEVAGEAKNDSLKSMVENNFKLYNSSINLNYRQIVDSLFINDQKVRTEKYVKASLLHYRCMNDSTYDASNDEHKDARLKVRQMNNADSVNISKLLNLIRLYGFPSEKTLGKDGYEHAFIILLHFDVDKDNLLLKPILDEALVKGDILPEDYAWIVDRRLSWGKNENPFYYQMPMGSEKLTETEIQEVNERRKKIGLRPLFEGTKITSKKGKTKIEKVF